MRRDRETGDDFERPYVSIGTDPNGKYVLRWLMTLFGGIILALFAADVSWQISEASEVSTLKSQVASMNAKLDFLVDLAKRTRGM